MPPPQVESYSNQIEPVADALRYLTPLGFDVLTYVILSRLTSGRDKVKDDGVNISEWLQNLSAFNAAGSGGREGEGGRRGQRCVLWTVCVWWWWGGNAVHIGLMRGSRQRGTPGTVTTGRATFISAHAGSPHTL